MNGGGNAAAVNKPTFLSILLFENEKNEEKWLIAALLPGPLIKENFNFLYWRGAVWWMELICFLLSFFWWVMAGGAAPGSAKRKRTKQKSKLMEFNQTNAEWNEDSNKPINNKLFFFLKEKSEVVDGVACCWLNEWSAPPIQLIELECFSLFLFVNNGNESNQLTNQRRNWFVEFDLLHFSSFVLLWVMSSAPLPPLNSIPEVHSTSSISSMLGSTLSWREREIELFLFY